MTARPKDKWEPLPQQELALRSPAYELLFGGAAGGGKSDLLLVAPLRWTKHETFRALILRRSFPELDRTLVARSRELYPHLGATYHEQKHEWTFPSGAKVSFGYAERASDVLRYQGAEFAFLGFDELTHFSEHIYRYLSSRARSSDGLPIRLRATTNPGGPGHEWVRARWGAWLSGERRAQPGELRRYDAEGHETDDPAGLSRTFVPASLSDNPYLGAQYRAQLEALDPVTRRQLLDGDWDARPARGMYFPPTAWRMLDAAPAGLRCVRAWDLAASPEGDWTVGVLFGRDPSSDARVPFVVLDVVRFRGDPATVRAQVLATAEDDGPETAIVLPQDPGQAGVEQAQRYTQALAGYNVRTRRPTGDKATRAAGFSAQASVGNVALVRGPWVRPFVDELAGFPEWEHDDQVDAAADAFAALTGHLPGAMADWADAFAGTRIGRPLPPRPGIELPDEDDEDGFGFRRRD